MCPLVIAENEARAAAGPGVRTQRSQPPGDYVCAKCSMPGHWIQQCPLVLADQQVAKPVPADYVCKVRATAAQHSPAPFFFLFFFLPPFSIL